MAWDPIPGGGYSGDVPIDVFATALTRIARAYLDRFGRRPTRRELLHALDVVLQADPSRYVEEAWPPSDPSVAARLPILPDDFEAGESDEPDPDGTYFVRRKSSGEDVLRCRLEVLGRVLQCEYGILDTRLDHADARVLVVATILQHLTNDHFADLADDIRFVGLGAPDTALVPYPR
jgi:hypothetical protein